MVIYLPEKRDLSRLKKFRLEERVFEVSRGKPSRELYALGDL